MTPPRRSRWLMQGVALAASFATAGLVVAAPETEQAGSDRQPTIQELMRRLEHRDAVIVDLQRRVGELERQIATTAERAPATGRPSMAAKPAPSVPSVGSSAEQQSSRQVEEGPAVASGAPPAAPGQFEVDEEAAERALERTLIQRGVLLLPSGQMEIEPSFAYTRNERDTPGEVFAAQNRLIASNEKLRRDIFDADIQVRLGMPFDSQLELRLPYRYVDQSRVTELSASPLNEEDQTGSDFGDIRIGLAKTLLRERRWWPDLVARVAWYSDTGEFRDGDVLLGGGFN
jgi:hypothetical protein